MGSTRHKARFADLRGRWADPAEFDGQTVRALPLFADLDGDSLELLLRSARELRVVPGEALIHRWHGTRHLYVIVAGTVEVRADEDYELHRGDFFGELAALDWGAGFGYARTADVVASSPAWLLILAPGPLGELLHLAPQLDAVLRTAARARLQRI